MNNSIIEPVDFLNYVSPEILEELKNTRAAFLCFDRGNFRDLIELFPGRSIAGLNAAAWLTDTNVLICGRMGIGAPSAVALLEELVAAGISTVISYGTAGALHDRLLAGDLAICSDAFPDEGTSRHYPDNPDIAKSSSLLLMETGNFLEEKGIPFKTVKAWTTDAPFRETPEKLRHFTDLGADVVEMEASALYHVASYRNIDLLALFVIGDSIANDTWKPSFYDQNVRDRLLKNSLALLDLLGN